MSMPRSFWDQPGIQFPRLLAEIHAVGLTPSQLTQLEQSMNLGVSEIEEIFDLAELKWEQIKTSVLN